MKVTDIASVTTNLTATPASTASFSVPLLLVDSTDVPIYSRYIVTSRSSYATDLTADSDAKNWATILWGQSYNIAQAYIGRWISAASSPHFVCGDHQTTVATWAAVSDGDLRITDGANTDDLTSLDFSSVTSVADVCTVIQAALQAIVAPNITGLDTATCAIDALDNIVITNSTTGAAAATISAVQLPAGAGTDISVAGFLDVADGFSVEGFDAEDLDDALAAILALDNTPFIIHQRGGSIAQKVALATAAITYKKICEFVDSDSDTASTSDTTSVGYQLNALSNNNCHITFTEHSGLYAQPDAAINGAIYPRPEGSASVALNALTSVYRSGLGTDGSIIELSATKETAVTSKYVDFLTQPVTAVHCVKGLTPGGIEVRHRIGFYWADQRIAEGIYAYLLGNAVTTFSDEDIIAIGDIAKQYLDILVDRKVIEDGYVLNLPSASSINATVKATHTLTLSEVATLVGQIAVNDVVMTMSASV